MGAIDKKKQSILLPALHLFNNGTSEHLSRPLTRADSTTGVREGGCDMGEATTRMNELELDRAGDRLTRLQ
jgi:hypothetical protein